MVVVMKPGTRQQDIDALVSRLKELDLVVGITNGVGCTILGLVGDTTAVDMDKISINPHVERVMRVQEGSRIVSLCRAPYEEPEADAAPDAEAEPEIRSEPDTEGGEE